MKSNAKKKKKKSLITCCIITTTILLLILTLVILYFTLLKPKQPIIVATPVSLKNIEFGILPIATLHVKPGIDVFIKNQNRVRVWEHEHFNVLSGKLSRPGSNPCRKDRARATQNVSTVIDLEVDKVIANPGFFARYVVRDAELDISGSTMVGDVILQKIFKLHATLVR